MNEMGMGWKLKLSEALWAYWIIYEKTCHLPVEMEHRAHWAIRKWNMNLKQAGEH